jgi:hypothetical protein
MLLILEQYLFYLLLFSIPFQIRKILWFSGWRFNEWQSVSIYFTDVLLAVLLLVWAVNYFYTKQHVASSIHHGKEKSEKSLLLTTYYILQSPNFYLIIFLIISAISIKNSSNVIISWYQWLKLAEFSIFYLYLSHYAFKKFGLFNSFFVIFFSGLFQAVIAIIQFLKQSSLGLQALGESIINSDLPGVASFYISQGDKMIRAYGTAPHPNILAGFFLLALFGFYFIYLYSRLHSEHKLFADRWGKLMLISHGIMLFALFSTFSRAIIFIWFMSSVIRFVFILMFKHYRIVFGSNETKERILNILLVSTVALVLFSALYSSQIFNRLNISGSDQAVELRSFYAKEAMGIELNVFGVGTGNFVGWLMAKDPFLPFYAYQPVHNIYLLIYSEAGILGIASFLAFLYFVIRDFIFKTRLKKAYHFSSLVILGSFLFIGFFDHFLWDLQQGRFILWFCLALLAFLKFEHKS